MGEQRRWVISVDEETHLLAEQWQADFSPLVGSNRSSLVRLVFKTLNRLGFTAETLTAALAQPQQLRQAKLEQSVAELNNLSHNEFPAFPSLGQEKKPLTRATHRRVAREGQAISHFNRKDVANQASGITPFRQLQHIHFTPLNLEVA